MPWRIGILLAPLFGNKSLKKARDALVERYHDEALLDGDRAAILRFTRRITAEVTINVTKAKNV